MKHWTLVLIASLTVLCLLVGCGNSAPSSAPESQPAPSVSQEAPASTEPAAPTSEAPASTAASSKEGTSAGEEGAYSVANLLTTVSDAAQLGATIEVTDFDLKASGMNSDNFAEMAGAQSVNASDNGGIAVVVRAAPGKAADVAAEFKAFRDARINGDYAEFAAAMENTDNARIITEGDYVVYAVSAEGQNGGYDTLDAALSSLFTS